MVEISKELENLIQDYFIRVNNWKKNKWFCLVCGELNSHNDVKNVEKMPSGEKMIEVICPKCKIRHIIWSNFKQKKLLN